MAKENTIPIRIPKKIYEELDKAINIRFSNKLISRKEMSNPEIFRLLGRTSGFQISLEELKIKPKRKDK